MIHKYQPYRPPWCRHPSYEGIDYCWGLAINVDTKHIEDTQCYWCTYADLKTMNKTAWEGVLQKEEK